MACPLCNRDGVMAPTICHASVGGGAAPDFAALLIFTVLVAAHIVFFGAGIDEFARIERSNEGDSVLQGGQGLPCRAAARPCKCDP